MTASRKRYLVTFKVQKVDPNEARDVLAAVSGEEDGLAVTTDAFTDASGNIHFDELGVSVASLVREQIEQLQQDSRVLHVVEDSIVSAASPVEAIETSRPDMFQPSRERVGIPHTMGNEAGPCWRPSKVPWNIQLVQANRVWNRVTGRGVKVGILSSGIDADHPDLSVVDGVCLVPGQSSWYDRSGIGTHRAGIVAAAPNGRVAGIAPDCSLFAIKVFDSRKTHLSRVLAGMNWAAEHGLDLLGVDVSVPVQVANEPCPGILRMMAERLARRGCLVVCATGNTGQTARPWVHTPARGPEYLGVGAVDCNRAVAGFSSRGPEGLSIDSAVELVAPGVAVTSTHLDGGYRTWSGTGSAFPHVLGAAALLKELHPDWSPQQIRSRLRATTIDLGHDPASGAGLLNCHAAVFARAAN